MKTTALLSIARDNHDMVVIEIRDPQDRRKCITVRCTPHEFGMAITGRSDVEVRLWKNTLKYDDQ